MIAVLEVQHRLMLAVQALRDDAGWLGADDWPSLESALTRVGAGFGVSADELVDTVMAIDQATASGTVVPFRVRA